MSVSAPAPLETFTMRVVRAAQQRQAGLRGAPGAEQVGLERLAYDVEVGTTATRMREVSRTPIASG
jgi:chloramphenicol 3-O-phosphotransferase